MMHKITAIIWKDTRVRFASASEWLFFIALPVVFTFIIGGGFGGAPGSDERIRLLVADEAHSTLSADLLAALQKSETVRADVLSRSQAEEAFEAPNASALLIIPTNFDMRHTLELRTQSNNLNGQAAARVVSAVAGEIGLATTIATNSLAEAEQRRPFASDVERQEYVAASFKQAQVLLAEAPGRLQVTRPQMPRQARYNPAAQASAGQLITWVIIPLIGISALFAYERAGGTLRRLLITPTQKATFLLGTITGQVVMALLQMALLILFGMLAMHLDWGQSPGALVLMLLATALVGAALGTMLGTFIKTEGQANGLSIMLGMLMALLGGCWLPIELFPETVRVVVRALPTTWAMQGLMDILVRGQDVRDIWREAGVLLGFAALFFAVGVWRFRYE
jgi:ABC-2 type transport system permease protein